MGKGQVMGRDKAELVAFGVPALAAFGGDVMGLHPNPSPQSKLACSASGRGLAPTLVPSQTLPHTLTSAIHLP